MFYDLRNGSYKAANVAVDAYRWALHNSDQAHWRNVLEKAIVTYEAWCGVAEYCEKREDDSTEEKKTYWSKNIETAKREVKKWGKAIQQFNPSVGQHDPCPTRQELEEFPFAEVCGGPWTDDYKDNTKKEVKILHTMFKYPYIRVEKLIENGKEKAESINYVIANQLQLGEEEQGELERFSNDQRIKGDNAEGKFIKLNTSKDRSSGLFEFKNFENKEFPPISISNLLNDYKLNYCPNYLGCLEMDQALTNNLKLEKKNDKSKSEIGNSIKVSQNTTTNFPWLSQAFKQTVNSIVSHLPYEETSDSTTSSNIDDTSRTFTPISSSGEDYYLNHIQVNEAWNKLANNKQTKDPIIIAYIDTGMDHHHPNLINHMWKDETRGTLKWDGTEFSIRKPHGHNYADDEDDSDTEDNHGHGTFCAGISSRVLGHQETDKELSQNIQFMTCKVTNDGHVDYNAFKQCLEWAIEHNANIINCSLSGIFSKFFSNNEITQEGKIRKLAERLAELEKIKDQIGQQIINVPHNKIPAILLDIKASQRVCGQEHRAEYLNYLTVQKNVKNNLPLLCCKIREIIDSNKTTAINSLYMRLFNLEYRNMLNIIEKAEKSVAIVTSAGNKNSNNDEIERYPANFSQVCENVLAVAGTNRNSQLWKKDKDKGSNYGSNVAICAPGEDIESILPCTVAGNPAKIEKGHFKVVLKGDEAPQFFGSGTSASVPQVSAAIAILMQLLKKDQWLPKKLINYLVINADDITQMQPTSYQNNTQVDDRISHFFPIFRLNISRALEASIEGVKQRASEILNVAEGVLLHNGNHQRQNESIRHWSDSDEQENQGSSYEGVFNHR